MEDDDEIIQAILYTDKYWTNISLFKESLLNIQASKTFDKHYKYTLKLKILLNSCYNNQFWLILLIKMKDGCHCNDEIVWISSWRTWKSELNKHFISRLVSPKPRLVQVRIKLKTSSTNCSYLWVCRMYFCFIVQSINASIFVASAGQVIIFCAHFGLGAGNP